MCGLTTMPIRFDKESEYHFTTFSSYNKEHILTLPCLPETLLDNLRKIRTDFKIPVFGFVVMPNHMHIVWQIPCEIGISKIVKHFKGRTGKLIAGILRNEPGFNISLITSTSGRVCFWKKRFYDFNILTEEKFLEKLDYMHENPVRWGLVNNPADWPYSSFRSWYDLPGALFEVDRI